VNKVFGVALLVVAFGAAAHTGSVSSPVLQAQVQSHAPSYESVLDFRTGAFKPAASSVVAGYYPECATMSGAYCSTVGARARCYWYGYSEPGLAVCQSDNTWMIY